MKVWYSSARLQGINILAATRRWYWGFRASMAPQLFLYVKAIFSISICAFEHLTQRLLTVVRGPHFFAGF